MLSPPASLVPFAKRGHFGDVPEFTLLIFNAISFHEQSSLLIKGSARRGKG